jgi:copper transport protein
MFRHRILIAFFTLLLFIAPAPALAHGYLLRAIPEDRAALERAPARIQYWFSEGLEPDFSTLRVLDQAGNLISEGGLSPNDDKLLTARLPNDLPDGVYYVDLRMAFASDGHVIAERRLFFVGEVVEGVSGTAAADEAVALEVVWRALSLAAATLLAGVFSLYAWVLVPAWGNRAYPAGLLPPRVMTQLYRIAFVALAATLVGSIIALVQQSMVFFGADAGRVVSEGLWNIVRTGTRFGDMWNARMVLLGIIAALLSAALYLRRTQPAFVRAFWTAGAWAMPLLFFTFSIAAHAAGALILPWLAILSDWLHGTMVGIWVGGLAALVLVLPSALQPLDDEARRAALRAALGRFSRLALAAALIVVATGIYNSSNWFTEGDDVATPYGAALALKLLMVGGLLLLGGLHHVSLHPERYARFARFARQIGALGGTLRIEGVIGIATVLLAGWVASTPVPQPTLAGQVTPPSGTAEVGELRITTTITPGGPGANTFDVQVLRDGIPDDTQDVRIQLINPATERRGVRHVAETSGDGLYVAAGAEITQVGDWWAVVDVVTGRGDTTRAAFVMPIRQEAAVQLTRDPTLLNIVALLGVLIAVSAALTPTARRIYRQLDLSPAAILVGVLGLLVGVGVVVGAVLLSNESTRQAELALFPSPQVVNTVLPDAESLARGREAFERACGWGASPDMLRELVERLPRLRDDELYRYTREGWRTLPICDASLDDAARWDIVNTLRTLDL